MSPFTFEMDWGKIKLKELDRQKSERQKLEFLAVCVCAYCMRACTQAHTHTHPHTHTYTHIKTVCADKSPPDISPLKN